MEDAEKQLIERCKAGELEQFGALYDRYIRKIYDFIYYKTHHRETAEDLTSQTFLKAFKAIRGFNPEGGSFAAWLYRIARNTVIDHYRTRRKETNIEDVWDLSSNEDIPRDTDVRLQLSEIQEALQKFSSDQRDIVLLRVWSGLSYAEIATIVGKSEASCKMSFSRTVAKLRKEHAWTALLLFLITSRYI